MTTDRTRLAALLDAITARIRRGDFDVRELAAKALKLLRKIERQNIQPQ